MKSHQSCGFALGSRDTAKVEKGQERDAHHSQSLKRTKSQSSIYRPEELPKPKKIVLEPGQPCESFEEVLATTKTVENGVTTYLISKALSGVMLDFASQAGNPPVQNRKQQIPEASEPIATNLEPHLPSYAAITHYGAYRQFNEDKVSVVLEEDVKWFGVYDGHGGYKCSQFLKENLHRAFFGNKKWRQDVTAALKYAFFSVENQWLKTGDNSGSCCLVTVIYEDVCYVANLGDSRAILGSEGGKKVYQITKDHKPSNPYEQKRVMDAGGKIYQTTAISDVGGKLYQFIGPLRVYPGRLSTTRTFGDWEAKDVKKGGNPNVVISYPYITSFNITDHDVIVMASDGLWDRVDNKEALKLVRDGMTYGISTIDFCKKGTITLLREAMFRGSTDNISVIVIGLPELSELLNPSVILEESGNQHIKVLSAISSPSNQIRKKKKEPTENVSSNKYNENNPSKLKALDSRIVYITRSAEKLVVANPR